MSIKEGFKKVVCNKCDMLAFEYIGDIELNNAEIFCKECAEYYHKVYGGN